MQFLSTTLLLLALSAADVHARPHKASLRDISPVVARAASISARTPKPETPAIFKRQMTECPTECSADTALLNAMAECETTYTDVYEQQACICEQMAQVSSACETCILNFYGITETEWDASCADASTRVNAPSTVCPTQCTTTDDLSGLDQLGTCSDNECYCASVALLSPDCLVCILQDLGVKPEDVAAMCAEAGTGTTTGGEGDVTTTADGAVGTSGSGGGGGNNNGSNGGGNGGGSGPQTAARAATTTGGFGATSTPRSAAGKIVVGGQGVLVAGAFVLVGGLMVLL
ncbi:hypothetical protein CALVIDRAFT_527350 [Calocera viscosa TUFC12733]|uniref:Extracellular membrane protein CFEM domain-containing protein n=1 Tax=Calocera viscosa (strain TUFC12733) TaxID=1330018 RepID=A0A167MFM8_CALVF|nr:hypothetical protein CALVIDRAFT_527350 [Calocera viscosa TUFC12733]